MLGTLEPKDLKNFIFNRRNTIPDIVFSKLEILLSHYPDTNKVWLCGSYANGTYVDKNTPQEIIELRKRYKGKSGLSDIDFKIEPYPEIIIQTDEYDLIPFNPKLFKILIYDQSYNKKDSSSRS